MTRQRLIRSDQHIANISRRHFLAGVGGLAGTVLFSGCGVNSPGTPSSSETRSVPHALGEATVPPNPARIVAITGQMDLDALLALGLQPVAAGANFEDDTAVNPWSAGRLSEDVEIFKFRPEVNVEQIATFRPDLIIGHRGWLEPVYDQLSQVASTVVVPYDGGVDGADAMWRAPLRIVARAVGQAARGEQILSELDATIAATRKRLSGIGDVRVSLFSALEGYQAYYTPQSYPGYLLQQLGLQQPEAQQEIPGGAADTQQIEFSNERLDLLEGDVAFCINFGADAFLDDWEAAPLFQALTVVEGGRYVRLTENESNAWYYPTVFTPPLIIASLLGHLERLGVLSAA
jgi:iron complex transport system substrate-binding protein